jgi:hypothetical protein
MDDIVKAALKKWPNVPHCYGWLALDARGDWYMRDDRIQQAGPFPQVKGSRITHDKLISFIERNYGHDEAGQWFFQNGPQRVYLQLEAAPWVWRVKAGDAGSAPEVKTHTGLAARVLTSWLDETGRLYLQAVVTGASDPPARSAASGAPAEQPAFGIVHTQDMLDAAQAVEQGLWTPQPLQTDAAPRRFHFVREPRAPAA